MTINIKHIKKSFFFVLGCAVQFMGCSIANLSLDMNSQNLSQKVLTERLKNPDQGKAPPKGIICFDFFNALFILEGPKASRNIESKIKAEVESICPFPNRITLHPFCTMVNAPKEDSEKIVWFTIHDGNIQPLPIEVQNPSSYVALNPSYNPLHVELLVKSFLEKDGDLFLRDPKGLKVFIVDLLARNHKVAFYACLEYPYVIPVTLKHIGLTEAQIGSIDILFSNRPSESEAGDIYSMWSALQKVFSLKKFDYQLILGDLFYKNAVQLGPSSDGSNQKGLYILMPISNSIYEWKKVDKAVEAMPNLIEIYKKTKKVGPWHAKLDRKPRIMGIPYKIIK